MAALTATDVKGSGRKNLTLNTLSASDTFIYVRGSKQLALFINTTGGAIAGTTLSGAAASSSYNAPGGPLGVDLSAGYFLNSLAAGAARYIDLDTIAEYLASTDGIVTIAGGATISCAIINPR